MGQGVPHLLQDLHKARQRNLIASMAEFFLEPCLQLGFRASRIPAGRLANPHASQRHLDHRRVDRAAPKEERALDTQDSTFVLRQRLVRHQRRIEKAQQLLL